MCFVRFILCRSFFTWAVLSFLPSNARDTRWHDASAVSNRQTILDTQTLPRYFCKLVWVYIALFFCFLSNIALGYICELQLIRSLCVTWTECMYIGFFYQTSWLSRMATNQYILFLNTLSRQELHSLTMLYLDANMYSLPILEALMSTKSWPANDFCLCPRARLSWNWNGHGIMTDNEREGFSGTRGNIAKVLFSGMGFAFSNSSKVPRTLEPDTQFDWTKCSVLARNKT